MEYEAPSESSSPSERILQILAAIPPGQVMSYGEVALRAGVPRGARQVARLLHACAGPRGLPWHRVVNREGTIALGDPGGRDLQRALLEAEGWLVDARGHLTGRSWPGSHPDRDAGGVKGRTSG